MNSGFWQGRRVLITGHTGFKGAWLTLWLGALGAEVVGLSRSIPTEPSLYALAGVEESGTSVAADVRDHAAVAAAVREHEPEVIFHLAAQPLVRRGLAAPRETYEINVMGTVNVLEAARETPGVRVVVNVSSESGSDNRCDPYSTSKLCSEIVTDSFRESFFEESGGTRVASARTGNLIGGGDWGADRLIPDMMRAAADGSPLHVRNLEAVRPWQHVLNPLSGYLVLAEALDDDASLAGDWS